MLSYFCFINKIMFSFWTFMNRIPLIAKKFRFSNGGGISFPIESDCETSSFRENWPEEV